VWVTKGDRARVRVRGLPGEEFEGQVTRSTWAVDPKARTLRTEIDVKNPGGRLRHDMFARAVLTVEHRDTWTLPATALLTQDEQTVCFRVENDRAVRTPVKLGIREGQTVEVLKMQKKPSKSGEEGVWEDLTGEEKIAQDNVAGLTDGQTVHVS